MQRYRCEIDHAKLAFLPYRPASEANNLPPVAPERWQRAADTAGAYHETWDETLSWLQMLINHEDGDSLSRALLMVEAGIRTRDASLCVQGCHEMKEAAQHLYHRDAFTLGNVL